MILEAAGEVDRPIVYAIAVIVAGFLPIYALTGPSGKLFTPMADTTIFALIGALVPDADGGAGALRLGDAARRQGAEEPAVRVDARPVRPRPRLVPGARAHDDWRRSCCSPCRLLIRRIGGEFMPHLDEGALWVRATMPYTISFEESSRIVPQIRAILRSFPEVTDVASEHGRPDDGTDPTGFFNAEFYVGLKPYGEWNGPYRTKDQLIEAINKKLEAFPGITFNYTQPAEDAVDEAETGLKSSLDVKVFGTDLRVLEEKGRAIKAIIERVPGITHVTLVQELGQPSLTMTSIARRSRATA